MALLEVKDLTISVKEGGNEKIIVDHINLKIPELSIFALVGGSGSGKTTTGLAILNLLPFALQINSGEIIYQTRDCLSLNQEQMRKLRGKEISMVFQEPLDAYNPVFSVSYQINEVLEIHTSLNSRQRNERILDLLEVVGIDDPKRVANNFPHQLSGGMRQRAMIAQAIAADPKLIIADEPTSNLDVTLQAKIIDLFKKLKRELNLSILLITHDLGMVQHMADHVAVMNEGKVVETGETQVVLREPKHVYTQKLLKAL